MSLCPSLGQSLCPSLCPPLNKSCPEHYGDVYQEHQACSNPVGDHRPRWNIGVAHWTSLHESQSTIDCAKENGQPP
jgi:hypothetical protein